MKEIRVKIDKDIPDVVAVSLIMSVMSFGKVSGNYCSTSFNTYLGEIMVSHIEHRKTIMFHVKKSGNVKM